MSAGKVRIVRWILVCALAGLSGLGCGEPIPKQRPAADHGEAPNPEEDPLGARVHAMGQERLARMELEGGRRTGSLRRGEIEDHLMILVGTHCYAFIAAGDNDVRDIDLILIDPDGAPIMHDTDQGREATLGVREQICPERPGSYEIRVRMFAGGGSYALQAYKFQVI